MACRGLPGAVSPTFIHLPARTVKSQTSQLVAIDLAELETALRRDQENAA